jgi:hypothetical protein
MRLSALRVVQMFMACAAIGILFCLAAGVISIVLAIHGTPNHISGDWILLIWAGGFAAGIPFVWLRMAPRPKNETGDGKSANVT